MEFQLKHLEILSQEKVDYSILIREVSGVTKWRFWNIFKLISLYRNIFKSAEKLRSLDPKNIEESKDCKIIRPENIDLITLAAMVELNSLFENSSADKSIMSLMTDAIAICCYSSNSKLPYERESLSFKEFRKRVEESNLIHMLGLYRWISSAVTDSSIKWDKLFFNVRVINQDYEDAGGSKMEQFNIITTLQNTCSDFNVSWKEAWQVPYGMTQVSSLSRATQSFIQSNMNKIVEERMRRERKNNPT